MVFVLVLQAAYTSLADQELDPRCTPASQAVALSVLPAFLALYRQPGTPATSLLSTQQLQLTQTASTAVTTKLTNPKFGLLAVEPACFYPNSQGPERADITLNAWGTWLAQQALSGSNTSAPSAGALASSWGSIQTAAKTWTKALETQLVADAVSARQGSQHVKPAPYSDLETVAWARLVLGASWKPNVPKPSANNGGGEGAGKDVSADVQKDLSLPRLTAAALAGNLTVGGRARTGLVLVKAPQGTMVTDAAGKSISAAEAVKRLTKKLTSSIRVGGRTAYVATGEGARSAAGEL